MVINGIKVVNRYIPQILSASYKFTPPFAGAVLPFQANYFQRGGNATIIVHWGTATIPVEPVPFTSFSHPDCDDNIPVEPAGCATIRLISQTWVQSTQKTAYCYEVEVPFKNGNQCQLSILTKNAVSTDCTNPDISGETTFNPGTRAQFCANYKNVVKTKSTTILVSFPNKNQTDTFVVDGPTCKV